VPPRTNRRHYALRYAARPSVRCLFGGRCGVEAHIVSSMLIFTELGYTIAFCGHLDMWDRTVGYQVWWGHNANHVDASWICLRDFTFRCVAPFRNAGDSKGTVENRGKIADFLTRYKITGAMSKMSESVLKFSPGHLIFWYTFDGLGD